MEGVTDALSGFTKEDESIVDAIFRIVDERSTLLGDKKSYNEVTQGLNNRIQLDSLEKCEMMKQIESMKSKRENDRIKIKQTRKEVGDIIAAHEIEIVRLKEEISRIEEENECYQSDTANFIALLNEKENQIQILETSCTEEKQINEKTQLKFTESLDLGTN